MPIVTYNGKATHREMRIGLRDLVFFPKIPMKVSQAEADEISRLVRAGEPYRIEVSPSEETDIAEGETPDSTPEEIDGSNDELDDLF